MKRFYDGWMPTLVELRGLTVELPTAGGWVRPVNEVSLKIEAGAALGLVGESGSGKTMLALALVGLLPEGARVSGEAMLADAGENPDATLIEAPRGCSEWHPDGKDESASGAPTAPKIDLAKMHGEEEWREIRGRRIAMVFQEPMSALNPVMRVGKQVGEAIRAHNPDMARAEVKRRAIEALERAAVPEPELRARQYPHELSGGLRQRALIAMAIAAGEAEMNGAKQIASGGRLLIADEPTTALDVTVQKQILELLADLRHSLGLSLLFITHDLAVVGEVADRVAVMYAGRVVEEGPAAEVLRAPRHPYTEGLLRASPTLKRGGFAAIPGTVPGLGALPPGCAFEPRCAKRVAECARAVPEMRAAGEGHEARCVLV
ncbi:MAG TPA: ABC transporter ATP-binding protein [Candidatus Acidoferrum sp.]|nr:ABC transporter ATP-binding protein [Candidatus Acidoferrum sp.]